MSIVIGNEPLSSQQVHQLLLDKVENFSPAQAAALRSQPEVSLRVARLAKLCSPQAFVQILDHIFIELNKAFGNGHLVGFEHRELKALHHGVMDHHCAESQPGPERYWGFFCATFMAAIGMYLNVLRGLEVVSEDEPDLDQTLAVGLLGLTQGPQLIDQISAQLEREVVGLLKEEFAIFCQGELPMSLEGMKLKDVSIEVFVPDTPDTGVVPIVMIQYQSRMLPVRDGVWNHIVAHLVREKLEQVGLKHHLQTGVVTWVIHGKREISDTMLDFTTVTGDNLYLDWQTVRPDRQVIGLLSINDASWDDQYRRCLPAIETHQQLVDVVLQMYDIYPLRNILAIFSAPREGTVAYTRATGPKQPGLRELLEKVHQLGYRRL